MFKAIYGISGDCATKNTAKAKGAVSNTRWNENGHVFVIDARGYGASCCGRCGRWSGCTSNATECIIVVAAAAVTAVGSKCSLPRDCGWVGE